MVGQGHLKDGSRFSLSQVSGFSTYGSQPTDSRRREREFVHLFSRAVDLEGKFSGLVAEYIVAIDVTRLRLRADASCRSTALLCHSRDVRNQLVHQQGKIAR